MARVSTATSRTRPVTTYKSKNSPSSRTLGANLKTSASKPSPKSNQKKAAAKKGKWFVAVENVNDEESMGSEDDGEDDGFDPKLKALVKQSGLTTRRAKLKPAETPTTSRTLVNRQSSRFPPLNTSISKHNRNSKVPKDAPAEGESNDDDSEGDELSFSNDGSDGLGEFQQQIKDMKKKHIALDIVQQGKENTGVKSTTRHPKERDQGRNFGKAIRTHENRSYANKSKPYDPPTTRHASKSRLQPKVPDAHVSKPVALTKTYDMGSSDSDGTESSNDQRVFAVGGLQSERGGRGHSREDGTRKERHRVEESDETESSEDELEDDEMQGCHGAIVEVRDIASVFKGIRKLFQSQANGVQKRLFEEVQPMHRATEKMYKQLGGSISEKMIAQQSLMEKSLEQHRETFHSSKREMVDTVESKKDSVLECVGQYTKIREQKKKALERSLRLIMELEKKQDKDVENLEGELGQHRDKYKGKAEKVLDPTTLNAKFAKQRKYIYQEVGI